MLLLDRTTVAQLLAPDEYLAVVEDAFRAHAEGRSMSSKLMHIDAPHGEFHVKGGGLWIGERAYFGLKANGGFFDNPAHGLPAIQGVIYVADAGTGAPLALLDSGYITGQRTSAATAVAAKYLSRPDAHVVTVCGAGRQALPQLEAVCRVRSVVRAYIWSRSKVRAEIVAAEARLTLDIPVTAVERVDPSDVVITCTPAHQAILRRDDVRAGTFIAAVGADSPEKCELELALISEAAVVCDLTPQCAAVGELHHAIAAGVMKAADVRGELGEVIIGRVRGRLSEDEIVVFDSTGTAFQDVAAAAVIYERALAAGIGTRIALW